MKTKLVILIALLIGAISLNAQVDVDVKGKVTNQADNRANRHTDNAIDKGFNKIEDGVKGLFKKKKNKKGEDESAEDENAQAEGNSANAGENNQSENNAETADDTNTESTVVWSRFDFIPGDEVIFEDAPSADEENGEFPSRWDLVKGNCEIIEVNGEKVIAFPQGGSIVPYLKNAKEDYLPEVFTIEFDAWLWWDNQRDIYIKLYDTKNQRNNLYDLEVNSYSIEVSGNYQELEPKTKHNGKWRHISIAYTRGKLKVYMDDTRLINIPHFEGNPSGLTIDCSGYSADTPDKLQYIKNIRIAKGGVKYYDRVLSEGKIIVNGIKFDVNKATLKPESIGPINEIYSLMNKNPEINFSVEGHTDSDGEEAHNQTLSEQRAKAVMDKLIEMGIDKSRLKSNGFGESKPIADNSSAEGKANNRRVEFVKF